MVDYATALVMWERLLASFPAASSWGCQNGDVTGSAADHKTSYRDKEKNGRFERNRGEPCGDGAFSGFRAPFYTTNTLDSAISGGSSSF